MLTARVIVGNHMSEGPMHGNIAELEHHAYQQLVREALQYYPMAPGLLAILLVCQEYTPVTLRRSKKKKWYIDDERDE